MLLWHGMLIPFGWDNCTNKSAVSWFRRLASCVNVQPPLQRMALGSRPGPVNRHLGLWPHVVLQRLNDTEPCIHYTALGPSLLPWANKCGVGEGVGPAVVERCKGSTVVRGGFAHLIHAQM